MHRRVTMISYTMLGESEVMSIKGLKYEV